MSKIFAELKYGGFGHFFSTCHGIEQLNLNFLSTGSTIPGVYKIFVFVKPYKSHCKHLENIPEYWAQLSL